MKADDNAILGLLTQHHSFALEHQQKNAWLSQIKLLKTALVGLERGHIFFEFRIPRLGKRADVVLLVDGIIFVLEFKVGSETFDRHAITQVHDYALDLKNFHHGCHHAPIVPVLLATEAQDHNASDVSWANDDVAYPIKAHFADLPELIHRCIGDREVAKIDISTWMRAGYAPTPTIIEAAQALYHDHDVSEIARSDAGAINLAETTNCILKVIEESKTNSRKSICFITGVPGAGKTLAGLNIAAKRGKDFCDEHAVFLSGNGPLVAILREALARDEVERGASSKTDAARKVASFVQNIHHFRDECLATANPPFEKIVIFDEAQRAWTREQAVKFMRSKRAQTEFNMSEPEFLIEVMDRHKDWCVVVCLVGEGQEINTGEAGLSAWLQALETRFKSWDIYISDRLDHSADQATLGVENRTKSHVRPALHLDVSMRSFRAEALSGFISHVIEGHASRARHAYSEISQRYPIWLTRDLDKARRWLQTTARGSERFGLVASSGAHRLRPEGLHVRAGIDAPTWFLNDREDIRSSFYLEEVATEFDVQGLELDWTCVCWDADFRYERDDWAWYQFRGTKWQKIVKHERRAYLQNAYRVLLTRARQGMIIFVPNGDRSDPTRAPNFYEETYRFLESCGLRDLI